MAADSPGEKQRPPLSSVIDLFKPGLAFSILVTAVPGLLLGKTLPSAQTVFYCMLGTMLVAMSSFCYNQILEMRTDALMKRTRKRVLADGSLSFTLVSLIASTMLIAGSGMLYLKVNSLAALTAFSSFVIYVFIYTPLLKPRTEHNTVIGGLSGSIGPLIGEAAATGSLSLNGFALFLLMFLWQPPHFWALAIRMKDDYARAGLAMMPVVRGVPYTIKQMLLYQILLLIAMASLYVPLELGGLLYLIPSMSVGILVLAYMFKLRRTEDPGLAYRIFGLTILHVVIWHAALGADLYLRKFT